MLSENIFINQVIPIWFSKLEYIRIHTLEFHSNYSEQDELKLIYPP